MNKKVKWDMVITSMLPPLKIETTFLPFRSRCFNAATVSRREFIPNYPN